MIEKHHSLDVYLEDFVYKNNRKLVKTICKCGTERYKQYYDIKVGKSKTCGFYSCPYRDYSKYKTHGLSGTRINNIWSDMKQRCYNKKDSGYGNYGGRGIIVCNEWNSDFIQFYNWAMTNGYSDDLTIDRGDVNGNYEPDNCRWVTKKEQANNKRNTKYIEYKGRLVPRAELARTLGISYFTLRSRHEMRESDEGVVNFKPNGRTLFISVRGENKALVDICKLMGLSYDVLRCRLYKENKKLVKL